MLCDACKKREAVVHIVKIEDGQRTDVHLCATCAKRQSNFSNMRDVNIIDNDFFRKMAYPDYQGASGDEPRCASVFRTATQVKRLRQHLQKLVQEERYEEAAKVRDEIRALQRQLPADGKGE